MGLDIPDWSATRWAGSRYVDDGQAEWTRGGWTRVRTNLDTGEGKAPYRLLTPIAHDLDGTSTGARHAGADVTPFLLPSARVNGEPRPGDRTPPLERSTRLTIRRKQRRDQRGGWGLLTFFLYFGATFTTFDALRPRHGYALAILAVIGVALGFVVVDAVLREPVSRRLPAAARRSARR